MAVELDIKRAPSQEQLIHAAQALETGLDIPELRFRIVSETFPVRYDGVPIHPLCLTSGNCHGSDLYISPSEMFLYREWYGLSLSAPRGWIVLGKVALKEDDEHEIFAKATFVPGRGGKYRWAGRVLMQSRYNHKIHYTDDAAPVFQGGEFNFSAINKAPDLSIVD